MPASSAMFVNHAGPDGGAAGGGTTGLTVCSHPARHAIVNSGMSPARMVIVLPLLAVVATAPRCIFVHVKTQVALMVPVCVTKTWFLQSVGRVVLASALSARLRCAVVHPQKRDRKMSGLRLHP